jgi:hypothetical protein
VHFEVLKMQLISTRWVSFSFRQLTNEMSNLEASYKKGFGLLYELETQANFLNQRHLPKLSDKQLIVLVMALESSGIDSERHLFKQLPTPLVDQIDRSFFNRRRRQLMPKLGRAQEADGARPEYGYCSAHKTHYIGYTLRAVSAPNETSLTFDI